MDDGSLIQGSAEWIAARVGSLGASRLHEAIAKTKTGYGASRANLMAELICERLNISFDETREMGKENVIETLSSHWSQK